MMVSGYGVQSNLKDISLECGGKSAVIIMPDADLNQTLEAAMSAVYVHTHHASRSNYQNERLVRRTWDKIVAVGHDS